MATTTATPETGLQKIESFFDHIGAGIEKFNNAVLNIANEEAPVIEPLLPASAAAALSEFLPAATTLLASVDAKYTALGQSTASWPVKVAEAIAIGGTGLVAILAKGGVTITTGQLPTILTSVGTLASNLNLATITNAPVAPASTTTAALA